MNQPLAMEMDETAWASAWARGDVRAYEAIVHRYAPMVHARCQRTLGSCDADDATQAVFLVLARKGDQAAASPVLAAWLYRVADLVIANAWRDRRRRRHAERSLTPPMMATEAEPAGETMDGIRPTLDACLGDLPARERETVLLHHLAGHSLAEVATLTGAPVSTVKYRLARGLQRLRALLATRGVTVGALALLACLQVEARAEVPAELLARLHDLAPARPGSAATAVPERSLRWSRTERPIMTRIALAGTALLLIGTALTCHQASRPAAAESTAPAADAAEAIDPDKARVLLFARCPDVPATIDRLLRQPEAMLLPPSIIDEIEPLRAVRRAEIACDLLSSLEPDQRRTRMDECLHFSSGARQEKGSSQASLSDLRTMAIGASLEVVPGVAGTALLDSLKPQLPLAEVDGQFVFLPGGLRFTKASNRGVPAPDGTTLLAHLPAEGDLEAGIVIHPGLANRPLEAVLSLRTRIEPDGLRVGITTRSPHSTGEPEVAAQRCEALPGTAVAGCVLGIAPGWLAGVTVADLEDEHVPQGSITLTMDMEWRLEGGVRLRDPHLRRIVATVAGALNQADGEALMWIQPAAPVPALWVDLPLNREAAADLTRALGGTDAGDVFFRQLGMLSIQGRWRDGHLIVTTDPAGPAGQPVMQGFAGHPEVQAALKSMPAQPASLRMVLRPAACLDQLLPYARMALPQETVEHLAAYRASMATATSWLVKTRAGDQAGVEAQGLLSLLAIAFVGNQLADPSLLINGIN